jgi:hypothetical protein
VWPVLVEVAPADAEDVLEVAAADDEDPVEAVGAERSDPAFGMAFGGAWIGVRDDPDGLGAEDLVEGLGGFRVAVV